MYFLGTYCEFESIDCFMVGGWHAEDPQAPRCHIHYRLVLPDASPMICLEKVKTSVRYFLWQWN